MGNFQGTECLEVSLLTMLVIMPVHGVLLAMKDRLQEEAEYLKRLCHRGAEQAGGFHLKHCS